MKALLLYYGGMELQDVYFKLPEPPESGEGETVFTVAMDQLHQHVTPQVNVPYEIYLFRNMAQLPTESIDQFVTRLRQKADYCQFETKKDENKQWPELWKQAQRKKRASLIRIPCMK